MFQHFSAVFKKFPLITRFVIFLLVPLMLGAWLFYVQLRDGLPPQHEKLLTNGLSAPVSIVRDIHGVPHIDASTDADVFFAIGYVHAEDRLWQLELQRRMVHGELSAVFGKGSLADDIWFRTLDLYSSAKSAWPALSPEAKASLTAYTRGLNAGIAKQGSLPIEFRVMGIAPQPWTEIDSLAWIKLFALNLSGNFRVEASRFIASQWLPEHELSTFFPDYPAEAPTTIEQFDVSRMRTAAGGSRVGGQPGVSKVNESEWIKLLAFQRDLERDLHLGGRAVGSNAWVVSGRHTETGEALLANDPHLGLQTPSLWYTLSAKGAKLNISGMSLVGVPFVIFGHNNRIGWGGTSMMADTQDIFFERTDPSDPSRYEANGHYTEFTTRTESIHVSAGFPEALHQQYQPVTVQIRSTRHGPVLSDVFKTFDQPVTLRWTGLDPGDTSYEAFYRLQYASDWTAFNDALRFLVTPALNMVYADRAGNIGYLGAGKIPIRKNGDGTLPSPGWHDDFSWVGYIPFEDWPRESNPESGYIVTANNKIVGNDYPYFISRGWASPARATRIARLLKDKIGSKKGLKLEDMQVMQADTLDLEAADLVKELVKLTPKNEDQAQAIQYLKGWNGDMARNSQAAAIFNVWMRHFRMRLFDEKLRGYWNTPEQAEYLRGLGQGVSLAALHKILTEKRSVWCTKRTCDDLLRASLESALDDISKLTGDHSLSKLSWGALQKTVYAHTPFSQLKPLDFVFGSRIANGGTENSINVAGSTFVEKEGYSQYHGPAFRHVIGLGRTGIDYRYMNSPGQSGNVVSTHYDDMVEKFRDVHYFNLAPVAGHVSDNAGGSK